MYKETRNKGPDKWTDQKNELKCYQNDNFRTLFHKQQKTKKNGTIRKQIFKTS